MPAAAAPRKRLAALFLVALLGVVVVLALTAWAVAGVVGLIVVLCLVSALLAAGAAKVRRLVPVAQPAPTTHCTCCDGDHTAPVRVV